MKKQNYKESKEILKEINSADKILLNCHRSPDSDSIGSALALQRVLTKIKKKVEVICPTSVPRGFSFLPDFKKIKKIDFSKFNFKPYDLFICLDSSSPSMVVGYKNFKLPKIPIIVIDHHDTNKRFGKINLVDTKATSCGELLYRIFQDWRFEVDKRVATYLLTGILGDTGVFRYPGTGSDTLKVGSKLIESGADKEKIIFNLFHSYDFDLVKFWGEVLQRAELDKSGKFVWSAIPFEVYKKYKMPDYARETSASLFAQVVKETEFGIVMVEQAKDNLSLSMRSRTGFDISEIASDLGGGGHIFAAGAKVEGMEFSKAVEKVLKVVRAYVKKTGKKNT